MSHVCLSSEGPPGEKEMRLFSFRIFSSCRLSTGLLQNSFTPSAIHAVLSSARGTEVSNTVYGLYI